jgi:hypothetical protein
MRGVESKVEPQPELKLFVDRRALGTSRHPTVKRRAVKASHIYA